MPFIETVDELADTLADAIGVYGACSSNGETGCKYDDKGILCCRQGFVQEISERMRTAAEN